MKKSKQSKKATAKKASPKKRSSKKVEPFVDPETNDHDESLHVIHSNDQTITTTDQDELKNLKTFEDFETFMENLNRSGKKLVLKSAGNEVKEFDRLPDTLTYNNAKQMVRVQALHKYFTVE
ncbi:MAG TPA: hypothetical protein VJY62_07290 [Bacteroidia bacterium]|nr:hypothetical protein [Bacteroidia bacterium]